MNSLAQQSTNLPTVSLREQSASTLQTAIRLPSDQGQILRRTNSVLSLFYDPDLDAETKAELRGEFVLALSSFPDWAIQRAFDQWVKEAKRRPAPGDIVALASRQIKTVTDELARREPAEPEAPRVKVTPEAAAEIMAAAGFKPKSFNEAAE